MEPTEDISNANQGQNVQLIETHLQVSNLIKILFTINPNILGAIIKLTPDDLKNTAHYKIVEATYDFYSKVYTYQQEDAQTQKAKESAGGSSIITP
jgi:hypothetical protein